MIQHWRALSIFPERYCSCLREEHPNAHSCVPGRAWTRVLTRRCRLPSEIFYSGEHNRLCHKKMCMYVNFYFAPGNCCISKSCYLAGMWSTFKFACFQCQNPTTCAPSEFFCRYGYFVPVDGADMRRGVHKPLAECSAMQSGHGT